MARFLATGIADMGKSEQGFTLIELLISVTIALIISAAIFGIYANSAGTSAAMLKSSKLNQELYSLMLVMSNDIRRAGYVAAPDPATADPDAYIEFFENPQKNPFSQDDTELGLIDSYTTNGPIIENSADEGQCVLYTFDQNEDGILNKEEIFGFRLVDNVVEMRVGWDDYDPSTDTINKDCINGNWDSVTDDKLIKIQKLGFSRVESRCINAADKTDCYVDDPASTETTVETRQINIRLEGSLVNDPGVVALIEQDVRVRNDRVKEH
jgi:type IV pilus assembly protein PilW